MASDTPLSCRLCFARFQLGLARRLSAAICSLSPDALGHRLWHPADSAIQYARLVPGDLWYHPAGWRGGTSGTTRPLLSDARVYCFRSAGCHAFVAVGDVAHETANSPIGPGNKARLFYVQRAGTSFPFCLHPT